MKRIVLLTGGAGFIGSHLARKLADAGWTVRILDCLSPQIHGGIPDWLQGGRFEFIRDTVTSPQAFAKALEGVETVVHLAAETGTGQSMYEIRKYFDVNVQGTATLLEALAGNGARTSVKSVIVASSRAVYGEGSYRCPTHGLVFPGQRSRDRMSAGAFELQCPDCSTTVAPVATEETAPFQPLSIYGLTKQVQEQAVVLFARTNGLNAFALRYQNVYGPGQSLRNPYTGILAIFSNLARQGVAIDIYEDGLESRDFVHVQDVADATLKAAEFQGTFVGAVNIGSGEAVAVRTVADEINAYFGNRSEIRNSGMFRMGDIRHNRASTALGRSVLGFQSTVPFSEGLKTFLAWAETQPAESQSAYRESLAELRKRGLVGESGRE